MSEVIKIEQLTKTYGKNRGVSDLNLQVEEGEFFGFIGPNGAGKSTTIRTMMGLLSPTKGNCRIFGKDCWKEKKEILKDVGYLPAEASFYSGMKVKDILKLSADLRGTDCRERTKELCAVLQLNENRKAGELSFGNKKKVAIVCALQHNPKLLVLDEPTGGLDPLMQKAFFEIVTEAHQKGTTVFLSSHILTEVQRYCERAAVIKNGQILVCDRVENLTHTAVKKVSVTGNIDLSGLSKVKKAERKDDVISFLYGGEMDSLIAVLSKGHVTDLQIQEPDLEEIFLHYYEEV